MLHPLIIRVQCLGAVQSAVEMKKKELATELLMPALLTVCIVSI